MTEETTPTTTSTDADNAEADSTGETEKNAIVTEETTPTDTTCTEATNNAADAVSSDETENDNAVGGEETATIATTTSTESVAAETGVVETENNNAASSTTADIMLMPSPGLEVLSFAVSVPSSTTMDAIVFDDDYYDDEEEEEDTAAVNDANNDPLAAEPKRKPLPPPKPVNTSAMDGIGMVGTIIVLKTSYIVWFGWGQIENISKNDNKDDGKAEGKEKEEEDDVKKKGRVGVNNSRILGSLQGSQANSMGQFMIAMPPRKFGRGASAAVESSTSKLIGSDHTVDDDTIARPMACRLSQKCGKPVLISCHFDPIHIQSMGLDPDLLHGRAAALAEKRIWELLKPYHSTTTTTTTTTTATTN